MNINIKPLNVVKEVSVGFNIKKNNLNKLKKLFNIDDKKNISGGEDK
jgi:hypothetical protein